MNNTLITDKESEFIESFAQIIKAGIVPSTSPAHMQELQPMIIHGISSLLTVNHSLLIATANTESLGRVIVLFSMNAKEEYGMAIILGFKCFVQAQMLSDIIVSDIVSKIDQASTYFSLYLEKPMYPHDILDRLDNSDTIIHRFLTAYNSNTEWKPHSMSSKPIAIENGDISAYKGLGCMEDGCKEDCTMSCILHAGKTTTLLTKSIIGYDSLSMPSNNLLEDMKALMPKSSPSKPGPTPKDSIDITSTNDKKKYKERL
jgi:hypothetical protein